jgi:hypothetical protein
VYRVAYRVARQWPHCDAPHSLGRHCPLRPGAGAGRVIAANRHDRADTRCLDPPEREVNDSGGRAIQPLHVVDREEHGRRFGQSP